MGLRAAEEAVRFGSSVAEAGACGGGGEGKWLELGKNEVGKGGDYAGACAKIWMCGHTPLSSTKIPRAVFGARSQRFRVAIRRARRLMN
jgi:hypothetical protein